MEKIVYVVCTRERDAEYVTSLDFCGVSTSEVWYEAIMWDSIEEANTFRLLLESYCDSDDLAFPQQFVVKAVKL